MYKYRAYILHSVFLTLSEPISQRVRIAAEHNSSTQMGLGADSSPKLLLLLHLIFISFATFFEFPATAKLLQAEEGRYQVIINFQILLN